VGIKGIRTKSWLWSGYSPIFITLVGIKIKWQYLDIVEVECTFQPIYYHQWALVSRFPTNYGRLKWWRGITRTNCLGLFHRAISQSGVEITPEIFDQNTLEKALHLGRKLNCTGNTTELVACFRETSIENLVFPSYHVNFATSVEPPSDSADVFLPDMPLTLLQKGKLNRVPVIFGVTASEGLHFSLRMHQKCFKNILDANDWRDS